MWTAFQYKGYGKFNFKQKSMYAHRMAWLLTNGEIPDGMVVMHKCDITSCVNPTHLQLGTQKENVIDCANKGRRASDKMTNCPHGHELDGIKLYNGQRYCKECARIFAHKYRKENHEKCLERTRHWRISQSTLVGGGN